MPISFLEETSSSSSSVASSSSAPSPTTAGQPQAVDVRLKARQLAREFASHRFGVFKESGFRNDLMYPPFSSLAGLGAQPTLARWAVPAAASNRTSGAQNASQWQPMDEPQQLMESSQLRGFDEAWNECPFDTQPSSGLPANAQCLPYLASTTTTTATSPKAAASSFNLMSSDPFAYLDGPAKASVASWRQLNANSEVKWHFCGQNFAPPAHLAEPGTPATSDGNQLRPSPVWFEHNERAPNKQNKMCQERSALDVIRSSDDFRRIQSFR